MGSLGLHAGAFARRGWERTLRISSAEGIWMAMVGLVWMGLVLRSRGIWIGRTIPLWEDEAAWAIGLIQKPFSEHVIRAPGFMGACKLLVNLLSPSEAVLRLLPWSAGVGSLLVAPFIARRFWRSAGSQLLFVAVLALHPAAIDLAKEFKPYSVALMLHLLALLFTLRYADEGRGKDMAASTAVAFLGVLFSHDVVFVYPALFGAMAWCAFRVGRNGHLAWLATAAFACVALMLTYHAKIAPGLGDVNQAVTYWGNKYGVFFVEDVERGASRSSWIAARLYDLGGMAGMRRDLWSAKTISETSLSSLRTADALLWVVLCCAGLLTLLYQRRLMHTALLVGPLLVLIGFNYQGYWPLGVFRTNLFALAYLVPLAASAFDWKSRELPSYRELVPTCLLVLLPFVALGRSSHTHKEFFTADTAFTLAMRELVRQQGPSPRRRTVLALDDKSCHPWRYYTEHHPNRERAEDLVQRFNARCGKNLKGMTKIVRRALKSSRSRAFMLAAGRQTEIIADRLPKDLRIVSQKVIGQRNAVVFGIARAQ